MTHLSISKDSMNMKRLLPFFFAFITSSIVAQKYTPTDEGSKVHFIIRNFGIKTGGQLTGLKGEILFFTTDVTACHFNVSVDASTVDTDNGSRDGHLKGSEYFDAEKFPEITITSTRIDKTNKTEEGFYYFTGNLSLHGITKPISFPFRVEKENDAYLFTGEFQINRLDFGVGSSSTVLSNTVNVSLSVLAKKS
ncbi:YceI family protein [Ginsengibacter hankyongi]|uniref:YceI family protein n=2 Tax=Ginsengibacter hankyongi TaxID=2607284 RepID=A0A5J5IIS3_9BACT|nr:YceI family protein [Ginsengibacter hankyongi]